MSLKAKPLARIITIPQADASMSADISWAKDGKEFTIRQIMVDTFNQKIDLVQLNRTELMSLHEAIDEALAQSEGLGT